MSSSSSGGTTQIDDMIATTKRGILVTRFDEILLINFTSQLYRGYTRDGLWLIENGRITKPIKNLVFTESPLFALNNVEQLGVPQRVFHAGVPFPWAVPQPRIVPPMKVRDFSFTALTDAV
jgi:predicted Zn-dependent protease